MQTEKAIHNSGEENLSYKSKPKKHLQVMIGIRMSKELKSNLKKIKRSLGLRNDSEAVRFVIKEKAESI